MPDQIEQLKVSVRLQDNATFGINNFQKSIQSFSSGQTAQHIETFKRQSTLMTQVLKTTGLEATGAAKSFQNLSFSLLGATGAVSVFGYVVYKTASIVNEAAKQIADQRDRWSLGIERKNCFTLLIDIAA